MTVPTAPEDPGPTPAELESRVEAAVKRWTTIGAIVLLVLVAADLASNAYYGWVAHSNDERARRADARSIDAIDQRNRQFREHRLRNEEHAACIEAKVDELRTDIAALVTGKVAPAGFPPASAFVCKPAPFAVPSVEELLRPPTSTSAPSTTTATTGAP